MKVGITDYENYLYDHYKSHGIDTSLFMKLVEECFIETRQIFMNNSESSVLKCKVRAEWRES